MRNKLKSKILASFMLLVAMLAVAGTISIVEFRNLSHSVNDIIQDNYKTLEASKTMLEALEREDSGILLLMLGEWQEGRNIIKSADSAFMEAYNIALGNITELHEDKHLDKIIFNYNLYKEKWQHPIVGTEKQGNLDWYKNKIHENFLSTKKAIYSLVDINQTKMFQESYSLEEKSSRAIMHGIVSISAALVFSLLLNFFISKYFVSPISKLTNSVKNFKPEQRRLHTTIQSHDEIKTLELEISNLLERLVKNNK